MGVNTAEVYNNMALCCFYSHNFDSAFTCFERALNMADDEQMANIWYNIGCACTVCDLATSIQWKAPKGIKACYLYL